MNNRSAVKDIFKKTNKNDTWLIVVILVFPFLNESFPTSVFIYRFFQSDIFKYLTFFLIVFLFYRNKKRPSRLFLALSILEVFLMFSSLVNYKQIEFYGIGKMFSDIVSILSMALIVELFIDHPEDLIKGLMLNFEIAIYSYFLDIVLNLSGEDYYLRGLLGTLILWILPAICIALIRMVINKGYVRPLSLIIISLFVVLKVWNATTLVAIAAMSSVLLFGFVLMKFGKTKKYKIPLWLLFSIAILANVFILFIYTGNGFPLLDFVITKILKKSTDFTQRDIIWNEAIRMIREKPIFGHGSRPVIHVANDFGTEYMHSHNQLLQKMNESGIFGIAVFMLMHIELIRKVDKSENTFVRLVLIAGLFGIFVTYITEAYKKFYIFYLIFFLAYHCDELLRNADLVYNDEYD